MGLSAGGEGDKAETNTADGIEGCGPGMNGLDVIL